MPDETYNGWTNRATWLMSMYLDGNYDGEGTYHDTRALTEHASGSEFPSLSLSESLELYVIRQTHDGEHELTGIVQDMLGYAMAQVNWREIATNLLSES